MRITNLFRSLGFQLAASMAILIVAASVLVLWQVDGLLRENELHHSEDHLLLARDQLSQRLATDQELVVTGAAVLASQPDMNRAIAERSVLDILTIATEYFQRTGSPLRGQPGLQIYDSAGNILVRVHDPLRGSQEQVPPEVTHVLQTRIPLGGIRRDQLMGTSVYGIVPVVDMQGQLTGAIEILTAFDRSYLLSLERLLDNPLVLYAPNRTLSTDTAGPERHPEALPLELLAAATLEAVNEHAATDHHEAPLFVAGRRGRQFAVTLPLHPLEGAPLAHFYLAIEESEILAAVQEVRRRAFIATAFGTGAAVLLAIGISLIAARPIRQLVDAADRIRANDLDTPVSTSGPTEVIDLADALDDLRLAVRDTREAMLSVNRDLASRYGASTATLSETSQELAVMHRILAAISGDTPGGLPGITQELARITWVDGAMIALATEHGRLSLAASSELPAPATERLLQIIEDGIPGQRIETGISIADTQAQPATRGLTSNGVGGFAAQPMLAPDGVIGLVIVTTRRLLDPLPSRIELIRSVAREIAAMLERSELAGEVEEKCRIAESVLREMSDGVLVVTNDNRCRVANPAAASILGRTRNELVGHPVEDILPLGPDAIRTLQRRAAAPNQPPVSPLLAEINQRKVAISAGPFVDADPERAGMMILLRDLSAEAEAERVKQDFVSMVGHELRTPLTLIRTTIDLLNEGDAGHLNETQERIVEVLHSNTDRLMLLINDLLDMSAIDSGRMQIQPQRIDLIEVAHTAIEDAQPAASAKEHQITLHAPDTLTAWADQKRVSQVLANLLSNAIKYTPPGGHIRIEVSATEAWVTIAIIDNGIGIPVTEQAQLFEKFYRTSQGRRTTGGTGLGLAIARSIVEFHGGQIWCESDGSSGTTFSFTLPTRPL